MFLVFLLAKCSNARLTLATHHPAISICLLCLCWLQKNGSAPVACVVRTIQPDTSLGILATLI